LHTVHVVVIIIITILRILNYYIKDTYTDTNSMSSEYRWTVITVPTVNCDGADHMQYLNTLHNHININCS